MYISILYQLIPSSLVCKQVKCPELYTFVHSWKVGLDNSCYFDSRLSETLSERQVVVFPCSNERIQNVRRLFLALVLSTA